MSNENKVPLNLYGIMDNELARMHNFLLAYLALPKEPAYSHAYGTPSNQTNDLGEIYKRIIQMQDLLLQSLISHDKELQERIAELALTGVKDETKV
jgi:hypothetical protein